MASNDRIAIRTPILAMLALSAIVICEQGQADQSTESVTVTTVGSCVTEFGSWFMSFVLQLISDRLI
jgi:hypothetical protein